MALHNRPYRWYFFSGMGMTAGQGIQQLALAWLILELTDSVGQLGLSIFLRGVPMALLGLVGGVLADRYNRRRLLITNQLLTMLNLFILSALVIGDLAEVWHVYLSSILLGATMALTAPARQAMIRGLVDREEMMNAVALNSMQMNSSRIIWPTLAGGLIVFTGSGGALLLCGICYLFGALFMLPVPDVSGGKTTAKTSPIAEVVEGFRFTFSHSLIGMVMILVVSMGSFGLAFTFIAPAFAKQVLDFGPGEAGLFLMASGIGALLGSAALLVFEAKNRTLILVLLSLGFASSLIAISLNSNYAFAFLLMGILGLCNTTLAVVAQTIFQLTVPQQYLGRVMSFFMLGPGLASLVSLPLGLIGDEFGLRYAVGGVGLILLFISITLGGIRLPSLQARFQEITAAGADVPLKPRYP